MHVEHRIDAESRIVWVTIRGGVTFSDLCQELDDVHQNGRQRYCGIIDARDAHPRLSARDLPQLATHGRRLFGKGGMAPRAIIIKESDLVSFGLSRLFAKLIAPWMTMKVFDDVPSAVAYIEAVAKTL